MSAAPSAGALTTPLLMIALALLYYDVRVRKEALDLELMLASLGPPAPATSAALSPPADSRVNS